MNLKLKSNRPLLSPLSSRTKPGPNSPKPPFKRCLYQKEEGEKVFEELKSAIAEMLKEQETSKKAAFDAFMKERSLFAEAIASKAETCRTMVQEAVNSEIEASAFLKEIDNFPESKEALLKLIQNEASLPESRRKLLTNELKFIINLLAKTKEIGQFETQWQIAFDSFDFEEIDKLNMVRETRNYEVAPELLKQLTTLKEAIAANPNYIVEKQAEMKKNTKGSKAKK